MKIRIIKDVPIHREHGLVVGEVFEVTREVDPPKRHHPSWFVQSKLDKEVGIMYYEAEVVTKPKKKQ
jgi:hypothetical protein